MYLSYSFFLIRIPFAGTILTSILRIALDVTDRTIARYISELKDKGIIERKGPDNGGEWKII